MTNRQGPPGRHACVSRRGDGAHKYLVILPPSHIGPHAGAQEVKEADMVLPEASAGADGGETPLILYCPMRPGTQPAACLAAPPHASKGMRHLPAGH